MYNLFGALQNFLNEEHTDESSDSLFISAIMYSEKALELNDRNEIALSINVILPIFAQMLTCDDFEEFQPSYFAVREVLKKANNLISYYPKSPLANLLQSGAYFIKSYTPILADEENDLQLSQEFLIKSFDKSKEILKISPEDGITFYAFYLSSILLASTHFYANELLDAADIIQEFVDFAENHNLLSSLYP
jgi:hypothetical protein